MKKQIEEMTNILYDYTKKHGIMASVVILENYAETLYNAGYRKQAEGHWITHAASYECSKCGEEIEVDNPEDYDPVSDYDLRFCPHCGARMKGAEYGK